MVVKKSQFLKGIFLIGVGCSSLQAMQGLDNDAPYKGNSQEKISLKNLLNKMTKDNSIEEKKAIVGEFSRFTQDELNNSINQPLIKTIPFEQFENIFGNILESGSTLPDPLIGLLWKSFIQKLQEKYGTDILKWNSDVIQSNAGNMFLKYIKTDFLTRLMPIRLVNFFLKKFALTILSKLEFNKNLNKQDFNELVYILSHQEDLSPAYNLTDCNYSFIFYLIENYEKLSINDALQTLISQKILPRIALNPSDVRKLKELFKQNSTQAINNSFNHLNDFLSLNEMLSIKFPTQSLLDIYNIKTLKTVEKMIFSDLPGMRLNTNSRNSAFSSKKQLLSKIIYNLEGYTTDRYGRGDIKDLPEESGVFHIGKPLALKAGDFIRTTETLENSKGEMVQRNIPIGYNVYLPFGGIKGIIVHVYGGFTGKDRLSKISKPSTYLGELDSYLLGQGIAIVQLNLLNLLDFEVESFDEMPESLHEKLHASIHKFYESIRGKDIEKTIFNEIPQVSGKEVPIYLYGGSFGGRDVVRHAELYPDTFDGYISHDGAISLQMVNMSDKTPKRRFHPFSFKWLDPMGAEKIKHINQPILLLHNFDDNNVNIKVSLDFYKAAKKNGKGSFVTFFHSTQGNKASLNNEINKGHFSPKTFDDFERYAKKIAFFILQGTPKQHEILSDWSAYNMDIFADKYYNQASFEDRFISEAYRIYKNTYYRINKKDSGQKMISSGQAVPPVLSNKNSISSEIVSEKIAGIEEKRRGTEEQENNKFDSFWNEYCRPLYYMMIFFDQYIASADINLQNERLNDEINYLFRHNKFSESIVENVLVLQFPPLLEILGHEDINPIIFTKNRIVQNLYKSYLFDKNETSDFRIYLLRLFYEANPDFMKERVSEYLQIPELSSILQTPNENKFKEALRQIIEKDKEFLRQRLKEIGNLHNFNRQRLGEVAYLLNTMRVDSPLDEKKLNVKALTRFAPNQIKVVEFDTINPELFDAVFDNILESQVLIPDEMASQLWDLYMNVMTKHKGLDTLKWGKIPENAMSYYKAYKNTNTLIDYMTRLQRAYFDKYTTEGILYILNNMRIDRSPQEKQTDMQKLTHFKPEQLKQITKQDIPFEQFEVIFDIILSSNISLNDDLIGSIWGNFRDLYVDKNGEDRSMWKIIPKNALLFYQHYKDTDAVQDHMAKADLNAFNRIIKESQ